MQPQTLLHIRFQTRYEEGIQFRLWDPLNTIQITFKSVMICQDRASLR